MSEICEHNRLRRQCNECRLTQELHVAEEGLANTIDEILQLQRALAFWLPSMPGEISENSELYKRLDRDICRLVGYDGPIEKNAEELGWIRLIDCKGG